MKSKRGQIVPTQIVYIIIAIVVLAALVLFFSGKFRTTTETFGAISPQQLDVAITSCQFACDSANAAASSSADCDRFKARYCNKLVQLDEYSAYCYKLSEDAVSGEDTGVVTDFKCEFRHDVLCTCP